MSQSDTIEDLPPSAKLVYKVLEYDGPMTQKQLVDETMLAPRTVRYALERLDNADAVSETVYIEDARQTLYRLNGGGVEAPASDSDAERCAANTCSS